MAKALTLAILLVMTTHAVAQFRRTSLDGQWLFRADTAKVGVRDAWYADSLDRSLWMSVETPQYWEEYPGMADYDGWGWFFRLFSAQKSNEPTSLFFGGVDDDAQVWVNEMPVGEHAGYSEPFALDITSVVRAGTNTIAVLVKDYGGGGGIFKPVALAGTRDLDELLKGPYYGTPARKSANWVKDAAIYSVYLRSASSEGNFAGLEKRLPELKDLGITVLWLMPIHPVGALNRKGSLGSPYAVQDFYGINPEFGTLQDFKRLLASAKRNGMHLIIDLVADHTSWDSKLIKEHPDYFRKNAKGEIVSPNADWTDVAALDYSQGALRRYMIDMMRYWIRDVGIDGFRCDVAELVPTDFWEEARAQLDRIKPVMMLSEGSIPEHHLKAFDLTYAWNFYDQLSPLLEGKRPATLVFDLLKRERLQYPTGSLRMRFTTNHDKNAFDAPAVLKFSEPGLRLVTVLVNMIPGVPMVYTGEEVANDQRLSLFEKVSVDWSRPRQMGELWKTLLALRRSHMALSRGDFVRVETDPDQDICSFFRAAGSDKVFVVLNFAPDARTAKITPPLERLFPGTTSVKMKEVFSGKALSLSPGATIEMPLEGRAYKVFVLDKTPSQK